MGKNEITGVVIIGSLCALAVWAVYKNYFDKPKQQKETSGLNPRKYQKYKLIEKEIVSHNTRRFRFALKSPNQLLGLPCGMHISFRFFEAAASTADNEKKSDEMEEVRRPYTPVTSNRERGYFDMMIKVYDQGKMSQHLDHLKVNQDSIEARGPLGRINYADPGLFKIKVRNEYVSHRVTKIGMICGGTGITPMLQIIDEINSNENDKTKVSMIFGNVSFDDILLYERLKDTRAKHDNIDIRFILDKAPTDGRQWDEETGYVTKDLIAKQLPAPSDEAILLLCGPPIMVKICCKFLEEIGHKKDKIIKF